MPRLLKFTLVSVRDLLITAGPALVLVVAALWIAYVYIDPTPPSHVVMTTGPENSAYEQFAKQYQTILARHGITLELRNSQGSLDNLNRLNDDDSDVQVGFVQSGLTEESQSERDGLVSLGSLFVEPVWLFYHSKKPVKQLADLRGMRVNVGPAGSGLPRLANQLLAANRVEPESVKLAGLEDTPAVVDFLDGKLDVLMFSSAPEAPMIQMLLQTPDVELFDFTQAEAYSRRFPFLQHVVLPRGIVAFERNLPEHNMNLVAPTATLVATDNTHPAIIELLVEAAAEIHGGAGWFRRAGEYPTPHYTEIPVATEAARFYKSGAPTMEHYLPFWVANLVDRMWVVLISMLALILPLSRVVPPLYTWRVRSRVYRWYGQLREVEQALERPAPSDPAAREAYRTEQLGRLDAIEARVNRLSVPLSYADELYSLRSHIDLVRERIRQHEASGAAPANP